MNDSLVRVAFALLLPTAVLVWRHSKIVALAIALPLLANVYEMQSSIALAVEHPARVLVPASSMALAFAEFYAEARDGRQWSRPAMLGILVFSSGAADIAALPTFRLLGEWAVPPLAILVCAALIVVSAWPKRRVPWVSSSLV
jgi:hypothetical protein